MSPPSSTAPVPFRGFRGWRVVLGVIGAAMVLRAAEPDPELAKVEAEIARLLSRRWEFTGSSRLGAGWRSNILNSPYAAVARPFARVEVEALGWRPPRDGWEFLTFLDGDVLRYASSPSETGGEQQWILQGESRWLPRPDLRLSARAAGFLRDQVLDFSETESARVVAPSRLRGGLVGLTARVLLPAGFSLEPQVQAKRQRYRDYPGDYDEARGGGRLQWTPGREWNVSWAGFDVRRDYAQRSQYTLGGRALAGTRLHFHQRDQEGRLQTKWSALGTWNLVAAAGRLENRDEASGYFDFDQERARLEIGWQRAAWRVALEGERRWLTYRTQTVGAGLEPPARFARDREVRFRLERAWGLRWAGWWEYRLESSRSNEDGFTYRTVTVQAGVQRTF